ncbi:glycerophosphodiester phosphodiesterase [Streptomyces albiaxialis]|uniref:glycerophosphodiester phosphodiesterase n=1 Tax=Streptomyces albiaxialis TaxID=329523 RepID=UPI0031D8F7C0
MTNGRRPRLPLPSGNPSRHPFLAHEGPLAFAHRGGAAGGTENTLSAFARAAALGYRYMETDVHATADGRLVAFHDATLDRVTDGSGPIARLPWSEVRRARVAGSEPVPLFEELLRALPRVRWNVDVKSEAALAPLLRLLEETGAWERVCVGSFDEARVARAQSHAGFRLLTSLGTSGVLGLRLRAYGLPARIRASARCAQVPERHGAVRVVDRAFVRAAHARSMQVHVWTVNERERAEALLDLGVDGIMTDDLEMLRDVLDARGHWPTAP